MLSRQGVQLVLLTLVAAAGHYTRTAISPLQEAIRISLALSDNQMALLQGPALAAPMVLSALPLGLLIDRHSRIRLLLIFAALNTAGSVLTAFSSNFQLLFAARCLIGLTAPATAITALSVNADLYAPARRGRANMVLGVGQVAGMSGAFALGGEMLGMLGSGPNAWRWALACLSVPLLLVTFLTLALREPTRNRGPIQKRSARETFAELWRYRKVMVPLVAGGVMVSMADVAVLIWAAPMFSRSFALSPHRIGTIMAAGLLVSGLLGPILGGIVADVCHRAGGPRRTISELSRLTLLSVPAGCFAIAPEVWFAMSLLIVFLTLGNAISVTVATLSTVVVPNELRGLCMSVSAAAGVLLGLGFAPVMVSVLSSLIGGPSTIGMALTLVCVAISLLGAGVFLLGKRSFSQQP